MHNQRLREHEIAAIFSRRKQIINHLILVDTSVCHDSRSVAGNVAAASENSFICIF
ncbi:hypothetical protein ZIOFF_046602 [Zingiber officinale]|uniref:Uncharacterized protein n=1 Tax=Zingiber officinale TaxID=94328 RepID=A0A8J5FMX6_ZINOF|nr:hypothetical protein ZIOFF_046602 [Zingiber officinale]